MLLTWKHCIGVSTVFIAAYALSAFTERPMLTWGCVAMLCATGWIPSSYVPPMFSVLYSAYCSHRLGWFLKDILHPRATLPHSNYRRGCRLLTPTLEESTLALEDALRVFQRRCLQPDAASSSSLQCDDILVVPVPIFNDNYAYLCFSRLKRSAVAIDPADPITTLRMVAHISHLCSTSFQLTDVLCSHKHWDHAGGNSTLVDLASMKKNKQWGSLEDHETAAELVVDNLKVYGSVVDAPHGCNTLLDSPIDNLLVGRGAMAVRCLSSPGHTKGSLMFLVTGSHVPDADSGKQRAALFTGDCIFCGGCGAMFEVESVADVIKTYDVFHNDFCVGTDCQGRSIDSSRVDVFVGHEYSEKLYEELFETAKKRQWPPESTTRITKELARIKSLRQLSKSESETVSLPHCTIPSTLMVERTVNPLLTLKRETLVALRKKESRSAFPLAAGELDELIYASAERM